MIGADLNKYFIYHRKNDRTIGHAEVVTTSHAEAIVEMQEALVADGVGYNMPVLALITGGKK